MRWRWFYPLFVPFVLVATLASLAIAVAYRPSSARWRRGCLELVAGTFERNGKTVTRIWGRPGGQCWGAPVQWYASERLRDRESLRVHERCHAIQGLVVNAAALLPSLALGWFVWWPLAGLHQVAFAGAYGLHFLWEWAARRFGPWRAAYFAIWAERQAYRIEAEFKAGERPGAWR